MRLYSGMSRDFIRDTVHNRIAEKLKDAFFRSFRFQPPPSEVNAWRNSLRAVSQVIDDARLHDQGILLEYQLPMTSQRLDCMVTGQDGDRRDSAVIIELKQWERCTASDAENVVTTRLGGGQRDVIHPSAQVGQYQRYLEDSHTAFYEPPSPIKLASCAYLHNYIVERDDILFAEKFRSIVNLHPVFGADDVSPLQAFLTERVKEGHGASVLARVEQSKYRPSKKLLDHVGSVVKGTTAYVLLDEQLVVFERVLATARRGFEDRRKTVIIVRGGPGTGKSVIAINLLAELSLAGYNAQYATGSRAFTETLRKVIGVRGGVQFRYFNSYRDAELNAVDVLICDEAHRVREFSHSRFTPRAERSKKPQVSELIDASKVCVFLVDDRQTVRPGEIGTADYLLRAGRDTGCAVLDYRLQAQFRCAGSDAFVNWVNNTLGLEPTASVLWEPDDRFDFRIVGSPELLDELIREKAAEGHSARLTAGYCWPWSKPRADGTLRDDIRIGDFRRPWNARPEAGRLARGIPKAMLWAHDPGGLDQVGCVYTAQGFEFDYVGVIFGLDLVYDFDSGEWRGQREKSHDTTVKRGGLRFTEFVKNTYRVLLSRGLNGCFVHFMDKDTERFVRSRIEMPKRTEIGKVAEP